MDYFTENINNESLIQELRRENNELRDRINILESKDVRYGPIDKGFEISGDDNWNNVTPHPGIKPTKLTGEQIDKLINDIETYDK